MLDKHKKIFRISLFCFLGALVCLFLSVIFGILSLAHHQGSSVWIVPGNIIYLGALAMIIAALGALVSLVSGLLVVLKRPLVLLWLIPEALLFLGIVIYFIIIQ